MGQVAAQTATSARSMRICSSVRASSGDFSVRIARPSQAARTWASRSSSSFRVLRSVPTMKRSRSATPCSRSAAAARSAWTRARSRWSRRSVQPGRWATRSLPRVKERAASA